MFREHLTDAEVSYELKVKGLDILGSKRDRTRALRKVLSKEKSGEIVVPTELPEEVVNLNEVLICEGIQSHLRDKMRREEIVTISKSTKINSYEEFVVPGLFMANQPSFNKISLLFAPRNDKIDEFLQNIFLSPSEP